MTDKIIETDETPVVKPKKKNKGDAGNKVKKKKKVLTRVEEEAFEELNLPPHLSSWEITENPLDPETEIITFYTDGEPTTYIEINVDNLEGMMTALNTNVILLGDAEVTGWTIRTPEDTSIPSLLSLTSGAGVVATLPLDDKVLHALVPTLLKLYNPNEKGVSGFVGWMTRHKMTTTILGSLLVGIVGYSAVTVFII
jgi:hypothetical protein